MLFFRSEELVNAWCQARGTVRRPLVTMEQLWQLAVTWYATAGRTGDDLHERRRNSPWYKTKSEPSTSDMTAMLRRVLIAARFKQPRPDQPTCEELHAIRLAWEDAAA